MVPRSGPASQFTSELVVEGNIHSQLGWDRVFHARAGRDRVAQPIPGRLRRSPIETINYKASIGCSRAPAGGYEALFFPQPRKKGEILWSIRRNHRNRRGAENDTAPPGVSAEAKRNGVARSPAPIDGISRLHFGNGPLPAAHASRLLRESFGSAYRGRDFELR